VRCFEDVETIAVGEDMRGRVAQVVERIDQFAIDHQIPGGTRADRFRQIERLIGAKGRNQLLNLQAHSVPRPQTLRMIADALGINPIPFYVDLGWLTASEVREAATQLGLSPEEWEEVARRAGLSEERLRAAIEGLRRLSSLEGLADDLESLAHATSGAPDHPPIPSDTVNR